MEREARRDDEELGQPIERAKALVAEELRGVELRHLGDERIGPVFRGVERLRSRRRACPAAERLEKAARPIPSGPTTPIPVTTRPAVAVVVVVVVADDVPVLRLGLPLPFTTHPPASAVLARLPVARAPSTAL